MMYEASLEITPFEITVTESNSSLKSKVKSSLFTHVCLSFADLLLKWSEKDGFLARSNCRVFYIVPGLSETG